MIPLTSGRAPVSGAKETTLETYGLFGISFCVVPKEVMANDIRLRARDNVPSSVILANAHVIVEAQKDPQLKNAIANASLVIPDGMPVTWVLRGKGKKFVERYPGPDLMEDILRLERSAAHYLLGSTPDVLGRINRKFKGSVTGSYSPPFTNNGFTEQEKCRQLELIEKKRPDFIWGRFGCSKAGGLCHRDGLQVFTRCLAGRWRCLRFPCWNQTSSSSIPPKSWTRVGLSDLSLSLDVLGRDIWRPTRFSSSLLVRN